MIKKMISWIVLCVGILCIYISMASVMNQDEKMMIEDEPVSGGVLVEEKSQVDKQIEFYLGALILTGVGVKIISKNNT
ncbi:MAG: hypothetical protein RSG75_11040 [Cellulosilyticaceae bacterium]